MWLGLEAGACLGKPSWSPRYYDLSSFLALLQSGFCSEPFPELIIECAGMFSARIPAHPLVLGQSPTCGSWGCGTICLDTVGNIQAEESAPLAPGMRDPRDTWEWWDQLRSLCLSSPRIGVGKALSSSCSILFNFFLSQETCRFHPCAIYSQPLCGHFICSLCFACVLTLSSVGAYC